MFCYPMFLKIDIHASLEYSNRCNEKVSVQSEPLLEAYVDCGNEKRFHDDLDPHFTKQSCLQVSISSELEKAEIAASCHSRDEDLVFREELLFTKADQLPKTMCAIPLSPSIFATPPKQEGCLNADLIAAQFWSLYEAASFQGQAHALHPDSNLSSARKRGIVASAEEKHLTLVEVKSLTSIETNISWFQKRQNGFVALKDEQLSAAPSDFTPGPLASP
jgi:hypothetical protein